MNNGKLFVTWSQTPTPRKIYGKVFDTLKPWASAEAKLIYENTASVDMGDPSGIQLDNGKLLTIFYDTGNHHVAGVFTEESDYNSADSCSCKCHGSFIERVIFKIINFFQKLFGKNKICICGAVH